MAIKVTVNDREARVALEELARRVSPEAAAKIAGQVMVDSINETFEQEGHPPKSWRLLHAGSIAASFERGGRRRAFRRDQRPSAGFRRFFGGKKILQDRGFLKQSIKAEPRANRVTIGVVGPAQKYAGVQHHGATIRPKNKKFLRFPVGGGRFVFAKKVVIPARPFVLFKPDDPRKIAEAIEAAAAARD